MKFLDFVSQELECVVLKRTSAVLKRIPFLKRTPVLKSNFVVVRQWGGDK